jgi:DedD protein
MDRRVKERLVGASILVVLIVLIVPEMLSGPAPGPVHPDLPASAPEPVRNITVDLATSKAPEPAVETPTPSVPPPETASAVAEPTAPRSEPKPAALETAAPPPTSSIVAPTAPTAPTAPSAKAAGQVWAVQLGSFASHANADKLVRQLKGQGFAVYVLSGGAGSSLRYRVRVGPMADRGAATQVVAKLQSLGHTGSLVPPAR